MKKTILITVLFVCLQSIAYAKFVVDMIPILNQYQADAQLLNKKYPLKYTDAYFKRMHSFYSEWNRKLAALPYTKFTVDEKIDYQLIRRAIKSDQKELLQLETDRSLAEKVLTFTQPIIEFQQIRSVGKQPNAILLAETMRNLVNSIENTTTAVAKKRIVLTPIAFSAAAKITNQYKSVLAESFKFYDGYDPMFTSLVKEPYKNVDLALRKYIDILKDNSALSSQKDDGSGIIGNPIGREAFINGLKDEMIAYTPEEIQSIAMREFAWCDREMLKASALMGYGNDWKAAMEKVKKDYVEPGKQPELIKFLADEATNYVSENNLITVPAMAREGWSMYMLSAREQLTAPFFLGGESILIAYPVDGMTDTAKAMSLRGNNKHFSRATVFHELIPGHNLQYFMQNRYKTYRRPYGRTPFWTEGWALYWEMLLYDRGFQRTPEDKVGALFWRMHRCARIIFSINYHLGKWTPQQCIDFLVDRVNFERANAEAEVRRSFTGGYGPLYQIGYMLGGLEFRAMHKELVESGKMTNKVFHDRIMHENSMPVEMVRALLVKQNIPREFETSWKFAGNIQ